MPFFVFGKERREVGFGSDKSDEDLTEILKAEFTGLQGKKFIVTDHERREVNAALVGNQEGKREYLILTDVQAPLPAGITLKEEIDYCPHHNTLTRTGHAHFSVLAHAVAEYVDNSLQATSKNTSNKIIQLFVHLDPKSQQNYLAIYDNGCGMTAAGIRDFATYFLGIDQRGQTPEFEEASRSTQVLNHTNAFMTSFISKFGVGAIEAGFYIGKRIKVVTKTKNDVDCREFVMDEASYEARAGAGRRGADVFRDPLVTRACGGGEDAAAAAAAAGGEESPLLSAQQCPVPPPGPGAPRARPPAGSRLRGLERGAAQFTYAVLSLRDAHAAALARDRGEGLLRELCRIYHYHMHPKHYMEYLKDLRVELTQHGGGRRGTGHGAAGGGGSIVGFLETPQGAELSFEFSEAGGTGAAAAAAAAAVPRPLAEVRDDPASLLVARARSMFPFRMEVRVPAAAPGGGGGVGGVGGGGDGGEERLLPVKGCLFYYPFDGHKETHPEYSMHSRIDEAGSQSDDDLASEEAQSSVNGQQQQRQSKRSVFDVYWQGRLVPESSVSTLPFFPEEKGSLQQRDKIADRWLYRLKGVLFFNWFFPISNNKLKLKADPSLDHFLNDPEATLFEKRNLKLEFSRWLANCHAELDQEIAFVDELERTGACIRYKAIQYGNNQKRFVQDDMVKMQTRQKYYCQIKYFEVDTTGPSDNGKVIVRRYPLEIYGEDNSASFPLSRLNHEHGVVTEKELAEYVDVQLNSLPRDLKLIDLNTKAQIGEEITVQLNGDGPPTLALGAVILGASGQAVTKAPDGQSLYCIYMELKGETSFKKRQVPPKEGHLYKFKPFKLTKSGMHKLLFRVSDGKEEKFSKKIQLICSAGTPESLVVDGDFSEPIKLAFSCPLPAFSLCLLDKMGNRCNFDKVEVTLDAEGLRLVAPEGPEGGGAAAAAAEEGELLEYPAGAWTVYVDEEGFLGPPDEVGRREAPVRVAARLPPPPPPGPPPPSREREAISASAEADPWSSQHGPELHAEFVLTFEPGAPDRLELVPGCEGEGLGASGAVDAIEVENDAQLPPFALALRDCNGNRVAPGRNQVWTLVFGDCSTESGEIDYTGGATQAVVDASGCAYFQNIQVALTGAVPASGALCSQHVLLECRGARKRGGGRGGGGGRAAAAAAAAAAASDLVSVELRFRVLPSRRPTRAELWAEGAPLGTALVLPVGSTLPGLELRLFDQAGRQVDVNADTFGKGKNCGVQTSWGEDKWEAASSLPVLSTLVVDEKAGNCASHEVRCCFLNKEALSFEFTVEGSALDPDHWRLNFNKKFYLNERDVSLPCGTDLAKAICEIVLVDCYDNPVAIPEGTDKPSLFLRGQNRVVPDTINLRFNRNGDSYTINKGTLIEGCPGKVSITVHDPQDPKRETLHTILLAEGPTALVELRSASLGAGEFASSHTVQVPKYGNLHDLHIQFCDESHNPTKVSGGFSVAIETAKGTTLVECESAKSQDCDPVCIPSFYVDNPDDSTSQGVELHVKVVTSDGKKELKAGKLVCQFVLSKRIVSLELELVPQVTTLPRGATAPELRLGCVAENGAFLAPRANTVTFRNFHRGKKKRQRIEISTFHEKPVVDKEKKQLVYRPKDKPVSIGSFEFACTYEETSESLITLFDADLLTIDSNKQAVEVEAGPAARLEPAPGSLRRLQNLSVSDTAAPSSSSSSPGGGGGGGGGGGNALLRALCADVHMVALDEEGHPTAFPGPLSVRIGPPEGAGPEWGPLPTLEGSDKSSGCAFGTLKDNNKQVVFDLLKINSGCKAQEGVYLLLFEAKGLPTYEVSFEFSSDETRMAKIQGLQQKLEPLKKKVEDFDNQLHDFESELEKLKSQIEEMAAGCSELEQIINVDNPDGSADAVKERLRELGQELRDMEATQATQRRPTRCPRGLLPAEVQAMDPVAVPVQAGFVADEHRARILSFFQQRMLKSVLLKTAKEQRRAAEMGCLALSEETIDVFRVHDRSTREVRERTEEELERGRLPLPPVNAEGFEDYAVNMIELPAEQERLRDTLFNAIYGQTMVFTTLDCAQRYRAAQKQQSRRTGTILTLDGWKVPHTGLLDKSTCYNRSAQMACVYGQIPTQQRPDYQALQNMGKALKAALPLLIEYADTAAALGRMETDDSDVTTAREAVEAIELELEQLLAPQQQRRQRRQSRGASSSASGRKRTRSQGVGLDSKERAKCRRSQKKGQS